MGGLSALPGSNAAQIDAELDNRTLQQVIEDILHRFGGAVTFGECKESPDGMRLDLHYE